MSSVSYYSVMDGMPAITTVERFSVRTLGADVALHLANTLRDELNDAVLDQQLAAEDRAERALCSGYGS